MDIVQNLVVAVIVLAAALVAAWRLPGAATRLRYARGLKKMGLRRLGERLERRQLAAMSAGGCAACGSGSAARRPSPRG